MNDASQAEPDGLPVTAGLLSWSPVASSSGHSWMARATLMFDWAVLSGSLKVSRYLLPLAPRVLGRAVHVELPGHQSPHCMGTKGTPVSGQGACDPQS